MFRLLPLCLLLGLSCSSQLAPPRPSLADAAPPPIQRDAAAPRSDAASGGDAAMPDSATGADVAEPLPQEKKRIRRHKRQNRQKQTAEKTGIKPDCSCCGYTGGAYISPEHQESRRQQYRRCIEQGGDCSGPCSRPPSAAPRR